MFEVPWTLCVTGLLIGATSWLRFSGAQSLNLSMRNSHEGLNAQWPQTFLPVSKGQRLASQTVVSAIQCSRHLVAVCRTAAHRLGTEKWVERVHSSSAVCQAKHGAHSNDRNMIGLSPEK